MAEDETIVSEGDFSIIRDKFELEKKLPFIIKQLEKWDYSEPCGVKIGVYVNATVKSKSQSDLFHVWCREMERRWISKRPDCTEENMKMLMKRMFLGTEDIILGKHEIIGQVKSIKSLRNAGEWCFFLDQVYYWCADHNLHLDIPADSDYMKAKRKQVK